MEQGTVLTGNPPRGGDSYGGWAVTAEHDRTVVTRRVSPQIIAVLSPVDRGLWDWMLMHERGDAWVSTIPLPWNRAVDAVDAIASSLTPDGPS